MLTVSGPSRVNENSTANYTATARFSDGTSRNVTSLASWSENSPYASIHAGRLSARSVSGNRSLLVTASYSYAGVRRTSSKPVTIVDSPSERVLRNNVPVTGLSGAAGSLQYFKIAVPSGQSRLVFTTSGGSGNCDLYVKRGSRPTTTSFTARSTGGNNSESITISNPPSGDWYIMLRGYRAFSGLTLKAQYDGQPPARRLTMLTVSGPSSVNENSTANYTATARFSDGTSRNVTSTASWSENSPYASIYGGRLSARSVSGNRSLVVTASYSYAGVRRSSSRPVTIVDSPSERVLRNNVPVNGLSGATGSLQYFKITVPSGQMQLVVTTSGGSGDCDLYVKPGSRPTTSSYNGRSSGWTNNEKITIKSPAAGTWYIMLRGYRAYSGLKLTASYANSMDTGFDVALDGFSFRNDGDVIRRTWANAILDWTLDNPSGICLGMSSFARFWYATVARPLHPHGLRLSTVCQAGVCPYIAGLEQWRSSVQNLAPALLTFTDWVSNGTTYRSLKQRVAATGNPVVLGLYRGTSGRHAVLARKIVENGDTVQVYVYDPNHPGSADRRIEFNKSSDSNSISYSGYTRWIVLQ